MNRPALASALVAGALILFFARLGDRGFWNNHSETQRAEVSREMVDTGDWVVPHLNGKPFATKPPLGYWLMALSLTVRGVADEFAVRLPSALLALLGVLLVFAMGARLFGFETGLLAGAVLSTGPLWVWYGRQAGIDVPYAFLSSAAFLLFMDGRTGAWLAGSVLFGLAVLGKPPALWVVPLPLLLAAVGRAPIIRLRPGRVALTALIAAIVVLPWGLLLSHRLDGLGQIARHEALHTTVAVPASNRQSVLYYLGTLAAATPLVILLPWAFARLRRADDGDDTRREKLLWLYVFANVVVFSFGLQKKHYYLLPVFPALALILGRFLARVHAGEAPAGARRALWALAALLLAALLAVPGVAAATVPSLVPVSAFFAGATLLAALLIHRPLLASPRGPTTAVFGLSAVALVWFLCVYSPASDRYRSRRDFLTEARSIIGSNEVYLFDYPSLDAPFYLRRVAPEIVANDLPELADHPRPVFLLTMKPADAAVSAPGFDVVREHTYVVPRSRRAPRRIVLFRNRAA